MYVRLTPQTGLTTANGRHILSVSEKFCQATA